MHHILMASSCSKCTSAHVHFIVYKYLLCLQSVHEVHPINRTSAIQYFEHNNAVKIHDVIQLLSRATTKLMIYFHFGILFTFYVLRLLSLYLKPRWSYFWRKVCMFTIILKYQNCYILNQHLRMAYNSSKRNIVLPRYDYPTLTCLNVINTSKLQSLLSSEQEGQPCEETLFLRCFYLPCW